MKKICYFVNSLWYFELHWLERAKSSVAAGYEVYVLANFSKSSAESLLESGIKCINSNVHEKDMNPFVFLKDVIIAFQKLKLIDPDIIHCITIKPSIISVILAYLKKVKLVYSFVGLGRVFDSDKILYVMLRKLIIKFYNFAFKNLECKIIFEHEQDRTKILSIVKVAKQHTVVIDGAGINLKKFEFTEVCNNVIPKILFAGRMLRSKGVEDLIYVKKILQLKGVEIQIDVAGILVADDDDAIPIEQINHWAQTEAINWLGQISHINLLLKQTDIVVLPSRYPEGIPRILLEAGAVGRPCVVYDTGGCGALIINGYNGYIVEQGNVIEMAEKILKLVLDKKTRKIMGKNARDNIINRYDSEIIIRKTLKVYNDLL